MREQRQELVAEAERPRPRVPPPPARAATLRGIAEARAASELARHLIEAAQARDAVLPPPASAARRPSHPSLQRPAGRRDVDIVPILVGIALGSAALIGFWR